MRLFEFWRRKKERGAGGALQQERSLDTAQLKRLLGDGEVRAALGDSRVTSLLPPVGQEVFRPFRAVSMEEDQQGEEEPEKSQGKQEVEKDPPTPTSDLEAGKTLPFFYGAPPPELLYTPLEELDPFYQSQKTFLVISKGNLIHRFNSESTCFLWSPLTPLRSTAIRVLTHPFFSLVVMVTILINCVFMTMTDPPNWSYSLGYVFLAIYALELVVKIMSRGVCIGQFTFFKDAWNLLDVFVVAMGVVPILAPREGIFAILISISSLLRILKLLPLIPGMKTTLGGVAQILRSLVVVMLMAAFCLSTLAVSGQQVFMGILRQKCVMWPVNLTDNLPLGYTPGYYNDGAGSEVTWSQYINNKSNHYHLPGNLDALVCGNRSDASKCPEGFTCLRTSTSPNFGYTNYDSFGSSLLTMIRLMSHNFWENLIQLTLQGAGRSYLLFFMLLVFPCCFCVVASAIIVVAMVIGEQEEQRVAEVRRRDKDFHQIQEALKRGDSEEASVADVGDTRKNEEHTREGAEVDHSSCSPCWGRFMVSCLRWNCCGCWRRLKQLLHAVVMNPFFDLIIVLCLIANILTMAMEHYPMTMQFDEMLSLASVVFTFIFIAEMLLKVIALDPYGYFKVGWNIFEGIIVVLSVAHLCFYDVPRTALLLRVFRLARWWPSFFKLLRLVWFSLRALRTLVLLLLVTMLLFSVVGMQLFRQDYKQGVCRIAEDCELPRWHMVDFFHSFLVVFRVLKGDWIELLWDCMAVSGDATCVIYFMMLLFFGQLLILQLFLTMLLSSFGWDCPVSSGDKDKNSALIAVKLIRNVLWRLLGRKNLDPSVADSSEQSIKEFVALDVVTSDQTTSEVEVQPSPETQTAASSTIYPEIQKSENGKEDFKEKHLDGCNHEHDEDRKGNEPEDCCCHSCYQWCPCLNLDKTQSARRVWSNFRRCCMSIVQHNLFEIFMIIIILLSSMALVLEDMFLQQRQTLRTVIQSADQVFTFVFLLEMLLKWGAIGLKRYFTSGWSLLDFLILTVSVNCLTANMFGFSDLGVCSLRALLPLRILSRCHGLRVLVQTVVRTLPSLLDATLVLLTVYLVFSIGGVNHLGGKFFYCFNETSEELIPHEEVNNKTECVSLIEGNFSEIRWKNTLLNFDNVHQGYLSLLLLEASTSWFDILYAAVDATQVESQPVYESNMWMYLCWIIISSSMLFLLNFFIHALIDALNKDKSAGKSIYATEDQLQCLTAVKNSLQRQSYIPCPRPQNPCRARFYDLVTCRWFELFIIVVILLSVTVLMAETYDQSFSTDEVLHWISFACFLVFFVEFILKMVAFGCRYFGSIWNNLDFVALIVYAISIFVADLLERYFIGPNIFVLLRLARVVRAVRLVHLVPWTTVGTRKLFWVFVMSLPALANICLLLFILTFCFAVFGMFHFPHVKREWLINDVYNFETFFRSLASVLSISTSSSWFGFLGPMMQMPPDCDPFIENPGLDVTGNCGNRTLAVVFFTCYIVLSCLLLVHLYVAVVMETFSINKLSDKVLKMFLKTWRKFDPEDTQHILYSELSDFCSALGDPLRIPKPNTTRLIHMNLQVLPGDRIQRCEVLLALAKEALGESVDLDALSVRLEEMSRGSSLKDV